MSGDSEDIFGFKSKTDATRSKIAAIKPTVITDDAVPLNEIDKVGERHGFKSREPTTRKLTSRAVALRKRVDGPKTQFNVVGPAEVAERFIQFCTESRMSYWEGIEALMKRAGV